MAADLNLSADIHEKIHDNPSYNNEIFNRFEKITEIIHNKLNDNKRVLVFCYQGVSRSATIVAAYLMKYYNMKKEMAINIIRRKRLNALAFLNFIEALTKWESGVSGTDYVIDARMMLSVTLHKADRSASVSWRALNEAVLEKHQSGHTIWLDLVINGQDFARYSADGLIVSTPTGSTAYSMSARGPVVSPRHRALLITPVSPHMLFDRSLVLDPHESVHIKVVGTRPVDLAIDGRGVASLTQDDLVVYAPDTCQAIFIRLFKEPKFHQIVRAKFGLGDE
jgi:NAD+ kinase